MGLPLTLQPLPLTTLVRMAMMAQGRLSRGSSSPSWGRIAGTKARAGRTCRSGSTPLPSNPWVRTSHPLIQAAAAGSPSKTLGHTPGPCPPKDIAGARHGLSCVRFSPPRFQWFYVTYPSLWAFFSCWREAKARPFFAAAQEPRGGSGRKNRFRLASDPFRGRRQFRVRSTNRFCFSHGIMARSFSPTFSMSCSAERRRVALKLGWPAVFSSTHSRAKRPD